MSSTAEHSLTDLAGPFGAVGALHPVRTNGFLPVGYHIYSAVTGDPAVVAGDLTDRHRGLYGSGRAYLDPARARMLAGSETLERYALAAVDESTLVTASAADFGGEALDLDRIPRCSARELRRPGCPVLPVDKTQRIRWMPSLLPGKVLRPFPELLRYELPRSSMMTSSATARPGAARVTGKPAGRQRQRRRTATG